AGADKITIRIRLQSQPWHMYSGVIVRCILAASTLPAGKEAAKAVLAAGVGAPGGVGFSPHCKGAGKDGAPPQKIQRPLDFSGPNMDATPKQIIGRLENYSGLKLADAFAIPNLDREIKWHAKYARQNGIHVSPTFMIDGVVQSDLSSGDKVSDWVSRLLAN